MPVNRNALIRYKTLDKCLQNRYRKWTLEDLIDACSDALYEYEGIDKGVSRRTVQADIQMMRSDKLGYNAPIMVIDRKYYTYEDPNYSITNIPLTDQDLGMLSEAVEFMKQFQGFSHFRELDGMVQKLEDHIYSQKTHTKPVIEFEKNENLRGLEYLDTLYRAIIQKRAVKLTYQSFKARQANSFDFHPYLLKEFRNRWFIIGVRKEREGIMNLALDRILDIDESKVRYSENKEFSPDKYFQNAIGVSVSPTMQPERVLLYITHKHAPYVLTKPLHHSQQLVEKDNYGVTISLEVQHNFELEKEILGYGDGVKVIAPQRLRRSIRERLDGAVDLYNTDIHEGGLRPAVQKLEHKGSAILNYVYTKREVRKMGQLLDRHLKDGGHKIIGQRKLLKVIPALREVLFNQNLMRIVRSVDENAFLVKALYFNKPPEANWYVSWHQDIPINVLEKKTVKGYTGWTSKDDTLSVCPPEEVSRNIFSIRIHIDDTGEANGALKTILGSHNKRLSDSEIQIISSNSTPVINEVFAGGIQLMKPLLLHASTKTTNNKNRRVIHLEFASRDLDGGLEWAEKEYLS